MSEFNFKITSYSIHLGERARGKGETSSGKKAEVIITAVITCRGEAGERIAVQFYKPDAKTEHLKSLCHKGEGGKPSGIIWEDQANFTQYVDLLRNESPIWGYVETGKEGVEVRLYTGRWEPVGVGDEDFRTDPTN